jgi:hypothetical protein
MNRMYVYTTCVLHTQYICTRVVPVQVYTSVPHTYTVLHEAKKIFYMYHLCTTPQTVNYLCTCIITNKHTIHVYMYMYHTTTQTTCSNHIRRPLWTTQIIKCLCFKTFWSSPSTWFCFVSFQTYVFGYNLIHIVVRTTIMWI